MEDTPLKALYVLVFVLSSFGAPAQTLDADVPVGAIEPGEETSSVEYSTRSDNELTVNETAEQSTMPAQIVTAEPTMGKIDKAVDEADGVAITTDAPVGDAPVAAIEPTHESPSAPVAAIEPSEETFSVEYSTRSDDQLTVKETTEQSTVPAQIIATEPMIEELGKAADEADGVAITGPSSADDTPAGAIEPSNGA